MDLTKNFVHSDNADWGVCRQDIIDLGYNGETLTDEQMQMLAEGVMAETLDNIDEDTFDSDNDKHISVWWGILENDCEELFGNQSEEVETTEEENAALKLANECLYYCNEIKRHQMTNLCDSSIYYEIIKNALDVYNGDIDLSDCGIVDNNGIGLESIYYDYCRDNYYINISNIEGDGGDYTVMLDENGIAKLVEYLTKKLEKYYDRLYPQNNHCLNKYIVNKK